MGEFMKKVHPEEVSHSEVMFYLEEMMDMNLSDELEDDVYYDLKWNGCTSKWKYGYVIKRIRELQYEKF